MTGETPLIEYDMCRAIRVFHAVLDGKTRKEISNDRSICAGQHQSSLRGTFGPYNNFVTPHRVSQIFDKFIKKLKPHLLRESTPWCSPHPAWVDEALYGVWVEERYDVHFSEDEYRNYNSGERTLCVYKDANGKRIVIRNRFPVSKTREIHPHHDPSRRESVKNYLAQRYLGSNWE